MTDTEKATAAAPGPSRGVRLTLVISLALNLLVIGVLVGGALTGRRPDFGGGPDFTLGPFARALDSADRLAIRNDLRKSLDEHGFARRDRSAALNAFLAALRADPFDSAAVAAIFDGQRDQALAAMSAGQDVLLNRLEQMTPEARAAFADRLSQELTRSRDR